MHTETRPKAPATPTGLRFHWRLPLGGEEPGAGFAPPPGTPAAALPDLESQLAFCRLAERHGIDSLLTASGSSMPDPIPLVAALSRATDSICFMLACRPGLLSPTAFVQQINTLSAFSGGRLSLNVVTDPSQQEQRSYGDFLSHDERYRRADDFLAICHAFWRCDGEVSFESEHYRIEKGRLNTPFVSAHRKAPEIYFCGGSELAREIACRHADCRLLLGDSPEALRPEVEATRERGIEVGIRLSIVVRPTREEAVRAAESLVDRGDQACLVGTPDEIAAAICEYRRIGVSQLIFSGWPNSEALKTFGEEVLPLVRGHEDRE